MATLTIKDETTAGKTVQEFNLDFLTEEISVRELIRERVYQEVQDYNIRQPEEFRMLVQPTDAEQTLNGFRMKQKRQVDWKEQFEQAVRAFESDRILIIINDKQAESLEQTFSVGPKTEVGFVRLTPLVGG